MGKPWDGSRTEAVGREIGNTSTVGRHPEHTLPTRQQDSVVFGPAETELG